MAAARIPACRPRSLKCSTIWAASSRVGARTRARVTPRFWPMSRFRMGSANAAVLPLPVIAQARTSRPSTAGGMPSRWIGVGTVKPRSATPFKRLGCRLNEEKLMFGIIMLSEGARLLDEQWKLRHSMIRFQTGPAGIRERRTGPGEAAVRANEAQDRLGVPGSPRGVELGEK